MRELRIAHLYPKLLNLYGDMGNIITLKKRCEWRGINVTVDEIGISDDIKEHDLYFIGGGQDKQQQEVAQELFTHKDFLHKERDNGAVFLGICGGYQLFGHYYQPFEGEKLIGISLMDAYTIAGKKRFIGNVTVETDFLTPKTLVGFENHSGLTYLQGETKPLGRNIVGTEMFLLGIIGEATGIGARVLTELEINIKDARTIVENLIGFGNEYYDKEILFTERAKRVLETAWELAKKDKKTKIESGGYDADHKA